MKVVNLKVLLVSLLIITGLNATPTNFIDNYVYQNQKERKNFIRNLSDKQKIGQVILGIVFGESIQAAQQEYLEESALGNLIFFPYSNGLHDREQVKRLATSAKQGIEKSVGIPPLLAIDQEGGKVQRLQEGFSLFPGNLALGATQEVELAYQQGKIMGGELREVGCNLNLAPVVDVSKPELSSAIGERAFGVDPVSVEKLASELVKAFREEGIASTLKHFPGYGASKVDAHLDLPVVHKSLEQLIASDLLPYKLLAKKADAVMTAHVKYPEIDPDFPATLSPIILKGVLRDQLGYKGLVISDSLSMNAMVGKCESMEQAKDKVVSLTKQALEAGVDLVIIGRLEWQDWSSGPKEDQEMITYVINQLADALKNGKLSQESLELSVERVLELKRQLYLKQRSLIAKKAIPSSPRVGSQIAKKAMRRFEQDLSWESFCNNSSTKKGAHLLLVPREYQKAIEPFLPFNHRLVFVDPKQYENENRELVLDQLQKEFGSAEKIVVVMPAIAWLAPYGKLIQQLFNQEKGKRKFLLVGMGYPYAFIQHPPEKNCVLLLTHSSSVISLQQALKLIQQKQAPLALL